MGYDGILPLQKLRCKGNTKTQKIWGALIAEMQQKRFFHVSFCNIPSLKDNADTRICGYSY